MEYISDSDEDIESNSKDSAGMENIENVEDNGDKNPIQIEVDVEKPEKQEEEEMLPTEWKMGKKQKRVLPSWMMELKAPVKGVKTANFNNKKRKAILFSL